MLETALASLRLGSSMMFGWRLSRWSLDTMVEAMRQTYLERGRLGDDSGELVSGPALDDDLRRRVQGRRFRRQAVRAARETAYYGRLFERAGIDPAGLGYDDIPRVPLTPKEALRDDPEAFVRRGARPGQRTVSTGTTGWPTAVWFSEDELHALGAFAAMAALVTRRLLPEDVVHVAISSRARLAVGSTARAAAALGAAHDTVGLIPPEQTLRLLASRRNLPGHKPRVSLLLTYPSYLGTLVSSGLELGYRPADFGVERVVLGGEVATAGLLERSRRLLGERVQFLEGYAMTETVPLAGEPCTQGHLHYQPLVGLLEVLDLERRGPVRPGEPGVVVATPLPPFRQTTLVLRYDTGDVVPTFRGPLTCERAQVPATGLPLGKLRLCVRHDRGWTFTREVVEALEAVEAVPLPAHYGFRAVPGGIAVEVAVRSDTPGTRRRLGEQLEAGGVPLAELRLVEDPARLTAPVPLRCHLREATFTGPLDRPGAPASRPVPERGHPQTTTGLLAAGRAPRR
ncbi:MAG TPA: AMP-binding protein [Actinomycetota bacterium]|nr:AMP-binding protein [Actinomycetota bacterium]